MGCLGQRVQGMPKSPASPLVLFRQDTAVIALKERREWQTKWDNYLSQDKPVQDRRRPGSRYCLISIVMRLCYELILASRKSRNCDLRASLVTQTVKKSACNTEDPSSVPGSGRSHGEGNGNPLQYYCLKNFMGREAWQVRGHGIAKS